MDYFTPQTIDIEISGIFRPPAANLIHNARSKGFFNIYTKAAIVVHTWQRDSHEYLMQNGNISGTREIRFLKIYIY